jgi:4-amino-4-deoxy-L-arabinose transferase-like glycosyltransferase
MMRRCFEQMSLTNKSGGDRGFEYNTGRAENNGDRRQRRDRFGCINLIREIESGGSTRRLGIDTLWPIVAVLTLAFALRVPLLHGPRFLPDEALFASFARAIAVWRDPMLVVAPVDKPPLLFYLQALCYPFLGPKEMAARLPNLIASLLTVALTFQITRRFSSSRQILSPLLSAVLASLSPLAVAFGSTAFTDPLMVAWGMAALLAASGGYTGRAGLFLGLGMATKYQAVLFLPLVLGNLWLFSAGESWGRDRSTWMRFGVGVAIPVVAVVAWELGRSGRISLLGTQLAGYGEVRLIHWNELLPRLADWAELARYLVAPWWIGATLLVLALFRIQRQGRGSPAAVKGLLFGGWLCAYFLLHWLFNIKPWDRYLLPIVPVVAILVGWSAGELGQRFLPRPGQVCVFLILVILLLPAALGAAGGAYPIGGDHGNYDGIEQVASFFADLPYGTVLYDHWLSWELRYYLFDSRVYVSWVPDGTALVRDSKAIGADPPRYLIVPTWEEADPIIQAVREADFTVGPVLNATGSNSTSSFIVYTISH